MEIVDPKSLQEATICFSKPENCLSYLGVRRWPDGIVICPVCGSTKVTFQEHRLRWQCSTHHPKRQFSIKVGTIFEDSPLGLDKWLPAVWLLTNCKNGVSSWELSRAIAVTQKTAWFMLHRIRMAHQGKDGGKIGGPGIEIEADETMIGGKARFMHPARRNKMRERGNFGKTIVSAVLERHGKVRAKVVPNRRKRAIQAHLREHVDLDRPCTAMSFCPTMALMNILIKSSIMPRPT
jgi:transposase-like protein